MTKLTIAIVCYNNYEDSLKLIGSIKKNTNSSITKKIYVIDNGVIVSNPSDVKKFRQKIDMDNEVTYIDTGKNLGFGRGHNFILSTLDSEYHAIVNPDIVLVDDAFSSIINYMEQDLETGMCIPKIIDENGELQRAYRKEVTVFDMFVRMFCNKQFSKRIDEHTLQNEDYSRPFQVPFGQGSFLVIRTSLFKELNGFDDGFFLYLEDADLCKRVNIISRLMYFPDATVIHKWEKGSHKDWKLFKIHFLSMKYYFDKWGITWF